MTMPVPPIIVQQRVQELAESALPNAPIVIVATRRRPVYAARSSLARTLRRAASAIAPEADTAAQPC